MEIISASARHSQYKAAYEFEVSSSSSFGDMFDRMPKIVGSLDLCHAHFQGKLFVRPLGIPDTKLHTKFEVSTSSSSFGVTSLTFQCHVTSCMIAHMPFPIGSPLEPNLYL